MTFSLKIQLLSVLISLSTINIWAQDQIDFSAETLNNKEIVFSEINKDGPTLISFWALWCKPCRAEMRHLQNIYDKYKEHGFTIIGINQDSPRSVAKVKSYISSHQITFPIIADTDQEIFQQFNGQSIPLVVLFDKTGKVNYRHVGYIPGDEEKLEENIKSLLGL